MLLHSSFTVILPPGNSPTASQRFPQSHLTLPPQLHYSFLTALSINMQITSLAWQNSWRHQTTGLNNPAFSIISPLCRGTYVAPTKTYYYAWSQEHRRRERQGPVTTRIYSELWVTVHIPQTANLCTHKSNRCTPRSIYVTILYTHIYNIWCYMTWHDTTRHDRREEKIRDIVMWRDVTGRDVTWHDMTWPDIS